MFACLWNSCYKSSSSGIFPLFASETEGKGVSYLSIYADVLVGSGGQECSLRAGGGLIWYCWTGFGAHLVLFGVKNIHLCIKLVLKDGLK